MICPGCKKKVDYPKNASYDELWFDFRPPESPKVRIFCPNDGCLPSTILVEESPKPGRYEFTWGEHKGSRLNQVPKDYLVWLKERGDLGDLLLEQCIDKLL